jgi:DNA-binding MarR family transcriptional regulator
LPDQPGAVELGPADADEVETVVRVGLGATRGYVERRPNPADRRSRLVSLTERGAPVPPVTHAAAKRVEERWAELTDSKELEALRASLLRLLTQLRA